jgi:uncharacterized protein (DUF1778 family)
MAELHPLYRRFAVSLQPDEADALDRAAAARGVKPHDLLREVVTSFLRRPEARPGSADPMTAAEVAAAAASLERTARVLLTILPTAQAIEENTNYVRESLDTLSTAMGAAIGAITPLPDDDGGAAFGLGPKARR